jgi:ubiquinone/menaquinone biosynthesis C-methylase UbiE
MLKQFIVTNRELSGAVAPHLPQKAIDIRRCFDTHVSRYMNQQPGQVIADLGGGKGCSFAKYKDPTCPTTIIAVDVDEQELELNQEADATRLIELNAPLPFQDGEVDLVTSRWVMEHIQDMDQFMQEMNRILKPGGYAIHLCASRFAPFALINRLLPHAMAKRLLDFLSQRGFPAYQNSGFTTYYQQCYFSALQTLLPSHEFEVVDIQVNYYQLNYFSFFFPLFLLVALYEWVVFTLNAHNLAASILIVSRKRL